MIKSEMTVDIFIVEPTGSFINTRHGAQPEYVLRRNGVVLVRSTLVDCERERKLRECTGRNPLSGINGQIG